MARAPWPTAWWSSRRALLGLALLGFVHASLAQASAEHGGELLLPPDGVVAGWSVGEAQPSLASLRSRPSGEKTSVHVNAAGDFDWMSELSLRGAGSEAFALSGWLYLEQASETRFLLEGDGLFELRVDGRGVYQRQLALPRARGVELVERSLSPGWHAVELLYERRGPKASFAAHVVDVATGRAPQRARWAIAGFNPMGAAASTLVTSELRLLTDQGIPKLRLQVQAPAGVTDPNAELVVRVVGATGSSELRPGPLHLNAEQRLEVALELAPLGAWLGPELQRLELHLEIAGTKRRHSVLLSQPLLQLLTQLAQARAAETTAAQGPRAALGPSLTWLETRIARAAVTGQKEQLRALQLELTSWLKALEEKRLPYQRPGVHELALLSPFDGRPAPMLVHVPANYQVGAPLDVPTVALLHGYDGYPRRILEAFLDGPAKDADPRVPGLLVAPAAHGNAFYRGAGEQSVLAALDWAALTYGAPASRVAITGVSMGGTGTAELAFHSPERFAAAAPLCGYHSYFVRRDVQGRPLLPYERALMHRASTVSWAESGRHLPLFVAHGTKDMPLANSRVLTERYAELGYSLEQDWPELGHAVWKKTYANAGLFPWLSRQRRPSAPTRVTLASSALRYARSFWVEITRIEPVGTMAKADLRITSPGRAEGKLSGVGGLKLASTEGFSVAQQRTLVLNGETLEFQPNEPIDLLLEGSKFRRRQPGQVESRLPGLEGPIAELWNAPHVFVYGTGRPETRFANRDVALRMAAPRPGVELQIPVLADVEFDPASDPRRPIYVGIPSDHCWLAAIAARLPIRVNAQSLEVGDKPLSGNELGAFFVYPDPTRPQRLLGVLTAPTVAGLYRALSLPALLPDYVVYDRHVLPAQGQQVLGAGASIVMGGFFDQRWQLTAQ